MSPKGAPARRVSRTVVSGTLLAVADDSQARVLPRGRHRLPRAEVVASQRQRMLEAMAEAVAEHGYVRTSVADVVARAGVSTKTFYEQFGDREECFLAAYDAGVDVLINAMRAALQPPTDAPLARFERALGAYLHLLATETAFARTFLIEVYAAGPSALERRFAVQRRFADFVREIFVMATERPLESDDERFACDALVGAVSSLVTRAVAERRYDELPALGPPVATLVRRYLEYIAANRERPSPGERP